MNRPTGAAWMKGADYTRRKIEMHGPNDSDFKKELNRNRPKYIIVEDDLHICMLQDKVNGKMLEGYVPHGGLCIINDTSGPAMYFQAMIIKKEEAN